MEETVPEENVCVELADILDYVGDSVRPIREGLAVQRANHIVCLGYTKRDALFLHVKAYVLQSSHPADTPHEVLLKLCSDNKMWELSCSCKAGTRRCKHIIACLLHINQSKTVEMLTCTDAKQAWGFCRAEKTSQWGAKPIQDLCCVRRVKASICTDDAKREQILSDSFKAILAVVPQSALAKHMSGRNINTIEFRTGISAVPICSVIKICTKDEIFALISNNDTITQPMIQRDCPFSTPEHQRFYEDAIKTTTDQLLQIAFETSSQDTKAWKTQRAKRITASSCYGLYTYSKNKKPDWDTKIKRYLNPAGFDNKNTQYGKETEDAAFLCYLQKHNPNVKKTGFVIHSQESWIGGSPDGVDPTARVLLEIKCPTAGKDHGIQYLATSCTATQRYLKTEITNGETNYVLNKRHAYYAQVQVNMFLLNCPVTDFIIYSLKDNDFLNVQVRFDEKFVGDLITSLKDIYFSKMLPKLAAKVKLQTV